MMAPGADSAQGSSRLSGSCQKDVSFRLRVHVQHGGKLASLMRRGRDPIGLSVTSQARSGTACDRALAER